MKFKYCTLMKSNGGTGPVKLRQPSIVTIEVVLNPAKQAPWKMRECRYTYLSLSTLGRKTFFIIVKRSFIMSMEERRNEMITLSQLSKQFETKDKTITAVDELSMEIKQGEIFGVIGYSGAGKSTFVRLLNRLEEPTAGEVVIDQKNVTSLNGKQLREIRRDIGMIFQHFNLVWTRTVEDNIAFPLEIAGVKKSERIKRVQELIDLVGLTGREKAYPSQLSGGQKQRVG